LTRGSTGQIHSLGCKSRKRVKGARLPLGRADGVLEVEFYRSTCIALQVDDGDDRYGKAAVELLRHADAHPHHLTAAHHHHRVA
jgi:hypothetical protein